MQGVYGGWAWVRLGTAVAQRRVCSQLLREQFGLFLCERDADCNECHGTVEEMIYGKIARGNMDILHTASI